MEQFYRDPGQEIAERGGSLVDRSKLEEGFWDLSGDGGLWKKVVVKGEGDTPREGALCSIHYAGFFQDEEFDNSQTGKANPLDFHVGVAMVIKGKDVGVMSMRVGEKARFVMDPAYAWGSAGRPPHVPPEAVVEYEIELLAFENQLTHEEKYERALGCREEGNALFRSGDVAAACAKYGKAIEYLGKRKWPASAAISRGKQGSQHQVAAEEGELSERANDLRVAVLTNLMQCHFKLGDDNKGLQFANSALQLRPAAPKPLFRRGQYHLRNSEFAQAEADLSAAEASAPADLVDAIRAERGKLQKQQALSLQKEKATYAKMFVAG